MADKQYLSDRTLKALAPAKAGCRYEKWDTKLPGFGVRVGDEIDASRRGKAARIAFILYARFPRSPSPTRRVLGQYGPLSLKSARDKADEWLKLIRKGVDPAEQEERARLAEQVKRKNTFAAVAEDFIAEKLPGERNGKEVERDLRREFIPAWGGLPITDITDLQVIAIIKAKKRTAPVQARNLLALVKRLFTWAIDQRAYGLLVSPCGQLKPARLIGRKRRRDRVLSDDELFALWRAAKRMSYPAGLVYQLLTLTALRLNEVAGAAWSEFDPELVRLRNRIADDEIDKLKQLPEQRKMWVIPAERMKGKNETAQQHAVPLTDDMLAILARLPRFKKGGPFLFSTTFGETSAWVGDKIKKELDTRMLRTLKAMARKRGDDPGATELKPWVNHDIRRTVRTHLSRLRIPEEAREAVMAHVRPGIKGTYDLYDYLDEKREALTLWASRLRSIVEPAPMNVIKLHAAV
jgi:hypothetical protein